MIKVLFLFTVLILIEFSGCSDVKKPQRKNIIVVIESRLASHLKKSVDQYKMDLEKEGYDVKLEKDITAGTNPSVVRELLQKEYDEGKNLAAAVLIGNIAAPLYNKKKSQGDPYSHDYLTDFYYMDLDGIWEDTDKNGVLDSHTDTNIGFINWLMKKFNLSSYLAPEIWVSRIRADKLSSLGDEITLLKTYFEKNHSYRVGTLNLPPKKAFVVAAGLDVLKSGWGASPQKIYRDMDVVQLQKHCSDSLRKFLSSEEGYEWGIVNVFSGPRIHHFDYFEKGEFDSLWWNTKEGGKLIVKYSDEIHKPYDLNWLDIKSISPKVLFYHLLTSEVGRHDYPDYLAGTYIFTGLGLTAIAGTQHSGAVGVPVLYESLKAGKTIGEAWKDALIWEFDHSGEKMDIYWYSGKLTWTRGESLYKAVLIGDGTLKLPQR